jgi:regulator of replication initiation timing
MQQNNIPQTLPTLQKLIQRIAAAEKGQQKEIRITIQEARDLSLELSMLTARMSHNIQEIREAVKIIAENTQNIDVKFDGGKF